MPSAREAERTRTLRSNAIGLIASLGLHVLLVVLVLAVETTPKEPERPRVDLTVLEKPAPKKPDKPVSQTPPTPQPPPDVRRPEVPKKSPAETRKPERRPEPPPAPQPPTPPPPQTPATPRSDAGGPPPLTYGKRLDGQTLAAPGTGVPIPQGDTLAADPAAPRREDGRKGVKGGTGDGSGDDGTGSGPSAPLARVQTFPKMKRDSVAEYPTEVRRLGIQGRVVLELLVDEDGRVAHARVAKGLHPKLDEAALVASKGLGFAPGTVDGRPARVKIPYTYVFVLD